MQPRAPAPSVGRAGRYAERSVRPPVLPLPVGTYQHAIRPMRLRILALRKGHDRFIEIDLRPAEQRFALDPFAGQLPQHPQQRRLRRRERHRFGLPRQQHRSEFPPKRPVATTIVA